MRWLASCVGFILVSAGAACATSPVKDRPPPGVEHLAVANGGRTVAAVGAGVRACVFDGVTGRVLWRRPLDGDVYEAVAVTADGSRVALGRTSERITLHDAQSGTVSVTLTAKVKPRVIRVDGVPQARVEYGRLCGAITFSPDGRRVAAPAGLLLHVWDTGTGEELAQLESIGPVAWLADGTALATPMLGVFMRDSLAFQRDCEAAAREGKLDRELGRETRTDSTEQLAVVFHRLPDGAEIDRTEGPSTAGAASSRPGPWTLARPARW